jgi:hypothetical protein
LGTCPTLVKKQCWVVLNFQPSIDPGFKIMLGGFTWIEIGQKSNPMGLHGPRSNIRITLDRSTWIQLKSNLANFKDFGQGPSHRFR